MAGLESASGIVQPVPKKPSDSDVKTFPKAGKLFHGEQSRGVIRPASAFAAMFFLRELAFHMLRAPARHLQNGHRRAVR
jgi:hypothetical protein